METSTPRKQSQKIVLFGAARFFPSHPPPRFTRTVTQLKRDLLFSILLGFLWRGSLIFYKLCFQGLSFVLISGSLTTIWLILLFFFPFCIFCNFPLTMIIILYWGILWFRGIQWPFLYRMKGSSIFLSLSIHFVPVLFLVLWFLYYISLFMVHGRLFYPFIIFLGIRLACRSYSAP